MNDVMVKVIGTEEGFREIRREWCALLANSLSECVFLTWEWLFTWWRHFGAGRKLHLLLVRSGRDVIAIAPFCIAFTPLSRLTGVRVLEFLGTGSVGSDYLDVFASHGREKEAITALEEYFLLEKFVVDLKQLRRGHALAGRLGVRLVEKDWKSSEVVTNHCPFIKLEGHTWLSFLESLGSKHRYNLHRRLKNLRRDFEVQFEAVGKEERPEALLKLVGLHNERRQGRGGSDGLHSPELVAFHEELTGLAMEQGWLRLFFLNLNGERAAGLYGFLYAGKFYFYQSGFSTRFNSYSVGLVVMGLSIEAALQEGALEFDLLHGDEQYKSLWAKEKRDLSRMELRPSTPRGWLYAKTVGMNRFARKAARSSLTLLQVPVWGGAK